MKRKDYQKPTMKVVEIQQRTTLLTQSETETKSATLNVTYSEEDWEVEE